MFDWQAIWGLDRFRFPAEGMVYPGLGDAWVYVTLLAVLLIGLWSLVTKPATYRPKHLSFKNIPVIGPVLHRQITRPWLLLGVRLLFVGIFLLLIASGLFGTALVERNLATTLTWTVWWAGLIMVTYFTGSVWCAVCPWDVLATWLLRLRLWRRGDNRRSLQLRVPRWLRNIWPATAMLIILSWFELGLGLSASPFGTALLALVIVALALLSQALFERKPFCRYFCSVGRTVGFYGSLSPVALRPVSQQVCADCKTLECYHGTQEIEACPTFLVLGRTRQNTFCTSCGACSQSCPKQNVNWGLRGIGEEVIHNLRPHWDEAWFILILLGLTGFHGLTMLPGWEAWLAQDTSDGGQSLWRFSASMLLSVGAPLLLFALVLRWLMSFCQQEFEYRRLFAALALPMLPLAFAYHLAHNLNYLLREGRGLFDVLLNPFGLDSLPLSVHEIQLRQVSPLLPQELLHVLQAGLLIFGFWLALRILRQRLLELSQFIANKRLLVHIAMLTLITLVTLLELWLLMQPMSMRL